MKKEKIATRRIGRTINLLDESSAMESSEEDYHLIADIILLLAQEEYMSAIRATGILEDAQRLIPYISVFGIT